jgi:hypothetical protein
MIDLIGEISVEVAERIVRQRGQVNNGVKATEIGHRQIAKILKLSRNLRISLSEVASGKKVGVQSHDVVTGRANNIPGNSADVTFMTS